MAESERSKVSLRSASEKRSRGSPTGCTPLQKGKRSTTELKEVGESQQTGSHHCQPRRRRLAFAKTDAWSDSEQIALVEFILLHKPGRRWPAEQDPRFLDSAAEYIYVAMRSKRPYNIYTRYNYAKNAILSRDFANASCLLWEEQESITNGPSHWPHAAPFKSSRSEYLGGLREVGSHILLSSI